jgi:uncharacterized protein (UPF0335 family)
LIPPPSGHRVRDHLRGEERQTMTDVGGITAEQLKSYIERVERLEEEKAAISADVREVFAEAKANGFDVKIMRQVIRLRKLDSQERTEQEAILDLYLRALGMGEGP